MIKLEKVEKYTRAMQDMYEELNSTNYKKLDFAEFHGSRSINRGFLAAMVENGYVERIGQKRSARYRWNSAYPKPGPKDGRKIYAQIQEVVKSYNQKKRVQITKDPIPEPDKPIFNNEEVQSLINMLQTAVKEVKALRMELEAIKAESEVKEEVELTEVREEVSSFWGFYKRVVIKSNK